MLFLRVCVKDPMHSDCVQKTLKWFGFIKLQVVADISEIPLKIKRKLKTKKQEKPTQKPQLIQNCSYRQNAIKFISKK